MAPITATQIANLALMHCGSTLIGAGGTGATLATENSTNAAALNACYDIVRRRELRRNVWRTSIRNCALRALTTSTQLVTFPNWASGTTYHVNDIVTGSDSQVYVSLKGGNVGNDPTATVGSWQLYYGQTVAQQFVTNFSLTQIYAKGQFANGSNGVTYVSIVNNNFGNDPTVTPPNWNAGTTYASGNFVIGSDANEYQSQVGGNIGFNPVGDNGTHWKQITSVQGGDAAIGWDTAPAPSTNVSYWAGELVYTLGSTVVWQSQTNNNQTNPLTDTLQNWLQVSGAPILSTPQFVYPIGTGPESDTTTRNVFFLPNGFLREAPQSPKGQQGAFLGGPAGIAYSDWLIENNYLTSWDPGPIIFRFAADVSDPTLFDPLFVDGFALALALQVCEELTQSQEKLQQIEMKYKKFMGEARTVNGIETSPSDPPVDEYLTIRR